MSYISTPTCKDGRYMDLFEDRQQWFALVIFSHDEPSGSAAGRSVGLSVETTVLR